MAIFLRAGFSSGKLHFNRSKTV